MLFELLSKYKHQKQPFISLIAFWTSLFHQNVPLASLLLPLDTWWRGVDDVNDRPVGNPKRRCDEHSSKFSLSKKPRFNRPIGKSQTPEGDAC
jgi:hypothetical protein